MECYNCTPITVLDLCVAGLGEVLCALGASKLEKLMPEVISTTERTELAPHVREGYLMLYIYLPSTFKDDFIPFVGPVIPSVLKVSQFLFTLKFKAKVGVNPFRTMLDEIVKSLL